MTRDDRAKCPATADFTEIHGATPNDLVGNRRRVRNLPVEVLNEEIRDEMTRALSEAQRMREVT